MAVRTRCQRDHAQLKARGGDLGPLLPPTSKCPRQSLPFLNLDFLIDMRGIIITPPSQGAVRRICGPAQETRARGVVVLEICDLQVGLRNRCVGLKGGSSKEP